jgi:uncharacterized protein
MSKLLVLWGKRFMTTRNIQRLVLALVIAAGAAAATVPAAAQVYYWTDRPASRYYQAPQSRDFFSFPFSNGGVRPPPIADYSKAPPPRKLEAPPTSMIMVVGDSMADWLGYGLDETYADQPGTGVVREVRATAGLIRYDPKNETLDWPAVIKDQLANEKPNAIVVMLGLNDRLAIRDGTPAAKAAEQPAQDKEPAPPDSAAATQPAGTASAAQRPVPGGLYEFHTDQWAELYVKRIDAMIAALKTKGVPVLWVGLPALRGPKSTGDMAYLDELYRERAERAGIVYVDIWDGFVDDQGRYAVDGPDFEGQIRRLRTADGVHFTKAGAAKLASYVDLELRRVMSNHVTPVALPEPGSPIKPGAPRPDVGPVLPLTVSSSEAGGGGLLGAGNQPAPLASDPLAQKVLDRGAPIAAIAGRADDFSWPRPAPSNATEIAPQPVSLSPVEPARKAAAAHDDAKKPADAKKDAKKKSEADSGAANDRRSPRVELDGVPRPPKNIGGGF